jgi:hypothetical protein
MSQPSLHDAAISYLLAHQAEHLSHDHAHLIARCADHLGTTHGCDTRTAVIVSMQALGEITSRATGSHILTDAGTSFAVFVEDTASGLRAAFTAADLVRIARNEMAARRAAARVPHVH